MIKVYQVSSRYIMLIMHNNKYLGPTFNWFTYFVAVNNTACIAQTFIRQNISISMV